MGGHSDPYPVCHAASISRGTDGEVWRCPGRPPFASSDPSMSVMGRLAPSTMDYNTVTLISFSVNLSTNETSKEANDLPDHLPINDF